MARLDLESKLLFMAIGTCIGSCIWGVLQLIHPVSVPNMVCAACMVAIGTLLATWCSGKGHHGIAKSVVLAVCFGSFSFLSLVQTKNILPSIAAALISVSYALEALRRLRQWKRGTRPFIALVTDAVLPAASGSIAPHKLPMMPVRDMVIVPGMMTPFVVGREPSVRALEYATSGDHKIFLATQHDASIDDPKPKEISQFGCVCKVLQSIKMTDGEYKGNFKVLVEGLEMAKAVATDESRGFFFATVQGLNIKSETVSTAPAA